MTRKDYIALAAALKGAYPIPENNTPDSAWRHCVAAIAHVLMQDNPRFKFDTFYKACGIDVA